MLPLIPETRSAFASPADPRSMAQKKLRYPPTYYWLAALDVFAKGETIVSERTDLDLASGHSSSSLSLDAIATVHDPFFSPKKQHIVRQGRHHLHSHRTRPQQAAFTSYEFPADKNPFRTDFSSSHAFAGDAKESRMLQESGSEDLGISTLDKSERRKRKRKSDGGEKAEKDREDWRLPLGWGRTLVCIANEKASAEVRERERSLLQAQNERQLVDFKGVGAPASPVPRSFFSSSSSSEHHLERGGEHSSFSLPEPVTVTTPNGSTKNMASSQTPASRNAQLLRESAHHLLVLAVDQFTRGMLYMPRSSRKRRREPTKASQHHDDPDVDAHSDSKAPSEEPATSPVSAAGPASLHTPQSSPPSSLSSSDTLPPSLLDLLPFSRTRTLISIADAVLDVAAKLPVPDDRAYWGRWVKGILDVDARMNSPSSGQVGQTAFGFGSSSAVFSALPESLSAFSGIPSEHGPSPRPDDDVFVDQSATGDDDNDRPTCDEKENDESVEERLDASLSKAARGLAKARAWILMGTAVNEGTPARVREGEEKEAREALRKGTFFVFVDFRCIR